ncbi:MAG TPA: energy transducer TonB [Candidatus Eisenbacteria bacterium]|nr:energy transducer TonB [Candidatus Eisenbacteria bacterium]
MGSQTINTNLPGQEPELNLLIADNQYTEPLYKHLFREIDEFFFPKKLPPLVLQSKPEPVKPLWGFYDNSRNGVLGSTTFHVVIIGLIALSYVAFKKAVTVAPQQKVTVALVDPSDLPPLKPSKTQAGGGGGGGDRDVLQASKGKLPKFSMEQITPPVVVVRNEHPKLTAEPTLLIPPQVHLALANNMPNFGDPMSHAVLPSNGTGSGSGIGSGSGGGVGSGKGGGFGPGEGGGTGGGVFRMGSGATPPRAIYSPEPEFSEEARKAKYQGVCTLGVIVDAQGHPTNIRVLSSLGMGLDEKAIQAVKTWRFEPAMKDGHPVPFEIAVEVDFHLY